MQSIFWNCAEAHIQIMWRAVNEAPQETSGEILWKNGYQVRDQVSELNGL